ncbi:hypothetical protein BPNPMPFG_002471 [Mesorhizobium sp. AR07]|uniref:hypothetical protein n=1 Tax=Mesorhizobium sp. AR07 TaxID=2865838 RepID=UPI002160017B|nr:hypothetical protein [Mesorhizobium sp. AR07]UVK46763.1 hypothetical protein BPNPMPFG_002471 [Mesorhizobium sp. AR07]
MWQGKFHPIAELVAAGTHKVEIFGNAAEGWRVYLVWSDDSACISIGPLFHREFGETLRNCRESACRAYRLPSVKKTRNWL